MATKNFGPLHYKVIEIPPVYMMKVNEDDPDVVLIPGRTVGQPVDATETPWKDVVAGIALTPTTWFIAVNENGGIVSCENDPTMVSIIDYDIWQIEHPGPREDIFVHVWTGTNVVDPPPPEA